MIKRKWWACGCPATQENTLPWVTHGVRCRACYEELRARNEAMARDYMAGLTRDEVARKYGIAMATVAMIFAKMGVKLSEKEQRRRSQNEAQRRNSGRERGWPDCPHHLRDDYRVLRAAGDPPAEARSMLEQRT